MTVTEFIIANQIRVDFGEGYNAYVDDPEPKIKAARVELNLHPTPLLTKMANLIRKEKGFAPIMLDDYWPTWREERAYRFTCDLNEYEPCKVDSFILFDVSDPDAEDCGGLYTIDLSQEEQKILYRVFCKQLMTIGKTPSELFREAWEETDNS